MTDKPKTIQEALAQVQELAVRPPVAKFGAKQMLGTAALAGGAAIASSPEAREKISNAYQGTKDFVKHSLGMDKTPEQSAASLQKAGEKISGAVTTAKNAVTGGGSTPAAPAKTETPKTEPAKTETPPAGSSAAKMSFNQAYAKAREMAKAAGKDPNIAQFKWSKDGGPEKTYQAAETKANYVTKNKQFAVDINAPSATKKVDAPLPPRRPDPVGIVPPSRGGTAFPADATGMPPTVTRNIPAGSEGAKYPAEGGVRQAATGTFEKGEGYATIREPKKPETESGGKKKMSEENYIDEAPLMGTASDFANFKKYNQNATYGQYLNTIRGLTAKKGGANDPNVIQGKMNSSAMKASGGPVATGKAWDPDKIGTPSPRPKVNTTPSGGGSTTSPGVGQPGGQTSPINAAPRKPPEQGGSSNPPGDRSGDVTPRPPTTPPINAQQTRPAPSGGSSNPPTTSGDRTPAGGYQMDNQRRAETESGGKKKMSEENNKLIDMFLRLQEKHALTPNIFEAAKKAKKDYDGDDKVESEKDEYFGSRFAAAKKAGKMEEDEQIDEATGLKKVVHKVFGKQIAKHRANKADSEMERTLNTRGSEKKWAKNYDARERYGRIAAGKPPFKDMDEEDEQIDEISVGTADSYLSKRTEQARKGLLPGDRNPTSKTELKNMTNAANRTDKDYYKNRGFKKVEEEVEFSQAEIDHINSFFEAVAPSRAEPTKGVNPTVRNTDLTDETLEEGRPRKNPTPETTERDARQHIQVQAGRASGGTVVDFKHDNGKVSKLTPGMGRAITAHLNGLKPAERQEAVKRMHASPEGLKV